MAFTTSGLTNGGVTTHYRFQYDDWLQQSGTNPTGPEPARTNAVIAAAEGDFNQMTGWFANIGLDVNFTIAVNITQNGGGASWSLSGGNLTITINPALENAGQVRYHLVMEMTEQFMRVQGGGWYGTNTEGSAGDALPPFLTTQFTIHHPLHPPPPPLPTTNP